MRIVYSFPETLKEISKKLEIIKNQGFDAIQLPPLQPLKEEDTTVWWKAFQPIGFRIGNAYGTKEELIAFTQKCQQLGLRVYADAIINHMGADNHNPLEPNELVDPILKNNPNYWKEKVKVRLTSTALRPDTTYTSNAKQYFKSPGTPHTCRYAVSPLSRDGPESCH